jgi:hypothetical protein
MGSFYLQLYWHTVSWLFCSTKMYNVYTFKNGNKNVMIKSKTISLVYVKFFHNYIFVSIG